jgi:hypothetical protein
MLTLLAIALFVPLLHGVIGPLDELELCVVPLVVVITVLVVRVLSERSSPRSNRTRSRRRMAPNGVKKDEVR